MHADRQRRVKKGEEQGSLGEGGAGDVCRSLRMGETSAIVEELRGRRASSMRSKNTKKAWDHIKATKGMWESAMVEQRSGFIGVND